MQVPQYLARRSEWLLALLALFGLVAFWAAGNFLRGGDVAHLYVRGQVVLEIDLAGSPDTRVDLRRWDVPATLEVQGGRVRFVEVDCPDHICEETGFISKDGQSAVCMPNRTAVYIVLR